MFRHALAFVEWAITPMRYYIIYMMSMIYEHVSYFTPHSLHRLATGCGLDVKAVLSGFGGQYLSLEAERSKAPLASEDLQADKAAYLAQAEALAQTLSDLRTAWAERLANWSRQGRAAVLWGAGSKGVTFLNIVEGARDIPFVVDISPTKYGKFVPGTGQAIMSPDALAAAVTGPVEVLCMNPVYAGEIAEQLSALGVDATLHQV